MARPGRIAQEWALTQREAGPEPALPRSTPSARARNMNRTALSPGRAASTGRGPVLTSSSNPQPQGGLFAVTVAGSQNYQGLNIAGPFSCKLALKFRSPSPWKTPQSSARLHFPECCLCRAWPGPHLAVKTSRRSFLWPLHYAHPQRLSNNWNVFPSPFMLPSYVDV